MKRLSIPVMARSDTSVVPQTRHGGAVPALCAAVVCIVVIDALPALFPATNRFVTNLDELAHAATAVIVVLLLRPKRIFAAALIAGGVAIDLDHVAHFAGWDVPNGSAARPYHSLTVVALLLAVAASAPRARAIAVGGAAGVAVHLWRDLATGPGVPLVWPVTDGSVRLPYSVYACSIGAAAVWLVAVRRRQRAESASS
jgi:inner membrane protein